MSNRSEPEASWSDASPSTVSIPEIVRRLNSALGATLVASLAGSTDPKISYSWARSDGPEPNSEVVSRLRCAYALWLRICASEGEQIARMWFIGSNPLLGHESPVDAIRADRYPQLVAAAEAMVERGFLG